MLRFDDQFPIHRKVSGLSDGGFRLHVEAIFWCRRNLTDGFVAAGDAAHVSRFARPDRYIAECVDRDVWHRVEAGQFAQGCDECAVLFPSLKGDGWQIHGYLDWQQSKSKVLQLREVRQAAGRNGGIESGKTRSRGKRAGHDPPKPNAKQVGSVRLEANANPRAPSPPLRGGSEGVGAAGQVTLPKPHRFVEGDDPGCCASCSLLRINKIHKA